MTFRSKLIISCNTPYKRCTKKEAIIENLCFRPERNERRFEFMELTPNEGIKETDG